MSVTLTLRVTSDKRKPGLKPSNIIEERIHDIIQRLISLPVTQNIEGGSEFLKELGEVNDLKVQLEKLRKGCSLIQSKNGNKENQERFYYIILVEIILDLELKSPLRSGIIRILKDTKSNSNPTTIKQVIADSLKTRFCVKASKKSILSVLSVTNALCGCFDNFPLAAEGVKACKQEAQQFIFQSLLVCKDLLSESLNTAEDTLLCQCVHALVRAALHVCSLGPADGATATAELHQLTHQLVACSQLPLDTRTNCGLLLVATGRDDWLQMLKKQWRSEDDLTSLCVYSGVIGSISTKELSSPIDLDSNKQTAFEFMFDRIMDIQSRNCLESTMTLSVARTLVSLSRAMLPDASSLPYMLPRLLTYTWEHLEHVMDSVKHLANTLLHNIARMHSPELNVYSAILVAVKDLPVWGRARHSAISTLIGKVPVSALFKGEDDISTLFQHLNRELISSHAVNAFQDLMKHHYIEIDDKEEWKRLWIKPLLHYLNMKQSVPLQQVLNKAICVCPDIVKYVLSLSEEEVCLGTTLLCLRLAHKLGLLPATGSKEDSIAWRGLVDYSLLANAIRHPDEQTRLSCLSLLVEAPKTTEVFTPSDLRLIKQYVTHNMSFETPASRQRNIALLSKFVSRFNDSLQILERSHFTDLVQQYTECHRWLQHSCVDSLFPGATFSRRVTALHFLSALGLPTAAPATVSVLLACLADSYEEVKVMAMRLLISMPESMHKYMIPFAVNIIERSVEQAGGVKPPDCLTAAYLLATFSQLPFSSQTLTAVCHKYPFCSQLDSQIAHIEYISVYCCLLIAVECLEQQLAVASESVLRAAASAPLYGLLFTTKLLLSQVNLRKCSSRSWKQLIHRLVDLSFKCSQAVAPIVNNDSPEGHFPMDFDFDLAESCGGVEESVEGVTSQMVLLCSWRTVKEVSLLLGYLAEEATIAFEPSDADGLLSVEDILRIGEHLTCLLAETKHRGAFEQAYVGFCKLVSRLWRLPSGPLRDLPQKWLEATMQDICSNNENLCATRRSAGIPFMIQALICTLLDVEGPSSVEPWITRLLDVAQSLSVPTTTRTHSLNILRALFRNTQLGEAVSVFVERAVIVTITAFSANSWMERNSATLLLSALMTRVFGVPRSKSQDNLSWKNKMTGRIFFQRYPKLFGFFQEELRKASLNNNLHPSLYPVLLILGRLYRSSLEGTDSNVQLTEYVPDILVCASSNIYKTRTLAASAMAALIGSAELDSLIVKLTQLNVSANFRHGLLLQVANFLKNSDPKASHQTKAESWAGQLIKLSLVNLSFMELEALFQVFIIILEKYSDLLPTEMWTQIKNISTSCLELTKHGNKIGYCFLRPRVCELLLKLSAVRHADYLDTLCCELLNDDMYEVNHTALEFISCLITGGDYSDRFSSFLKSLPSSVMEECRLITSKPQVVEVFVHHMVVDTLFSANKQKYHVEDKAKILSVLGNWKDALLLVLEASKPYTKTVHSLVSLCKDSHENVALKAVCCLTELFCIKEIQEEESDEFCKLLNYLNNPEIREVFHAAGYDLLERHFKSLLKFAGTIQRLQLYKTYITSSESDKWQTAVDRVVDSEPDVNVTAVLLTALTMGEFDYEAEIQSEVMSRVFDKGEVNDSYEEYILSKICGQKLHKLCNTRKDILLETLDPDLRDWLSEETGFTTGSGDSLSAYIVQAKLQVLKLDSNDPCQFLNQLAVRSTMN